MKALKNCKKSNNKGFSLVELIIVIAIMAVLVGTLAPQYIRYVEKSRIAADKATIDEVVTVLEVLAASSDAGLSVDKTYTVTFTKGVMSTSNLRAGDDGNTKADNAVYAQLVDSNNYTLKSSACKDTTISATLAYDSTNKIWKVTTSGMPSELTSAE